MTKQERIKKQVSYWAETAQHDWITAQSLWKARRYDACLFFCHLVCEKILKALVVLKTQQDAPRVHDLLQLAELAAVVLDEEKRDVFAQMNHFNIAARYPADQIEFYKLATGRYSRRYYNFTKEFLAWVIENRL